MPETQMEYSWVPMELGHTADVGRLHAAHIEDSALGGLGAGFMGVLYGCLLRTGFGGGHALVDRQGTVVGFSFFRTQHRLSVGDVIRRSWARLLAPLTRCAVTRPVVLLRAIRAVGEPGHVVCEPGIAEWMSLVLEPHARGSEASRRAVDVMADAVRRAGCHKVRWETLSANERAQAYYAKIGGRLIGEGEASGQRILWYEKDLDADADGGRGP